MKLSFEKITQITKGVSYITEEKDGVQFHRFNEFEEKYYSNSPWPRQYSTSGVKLAFLTDSTTMMLKVNVKEATPTHYFSHDVFCDQKRIGSLRNFKDNDLPIKVDEKTLLPLGDFNLGVFKENFNLGKGMKEVTIVFPWSVNSCLEELILDDGAKVLAVKNNYKMISFGDSITYGASTLYPSNRYAAKLSKDFGLEEICKAVGGEIFCPGLLGNEKEENVRCVTVAYGTNDLGKGWDDFQNRSGEFFWKITELYPEALIFAISPIWRKDCEGRDALYKIDKIRNHIKAIASQYNNIIFIDGRDLVPNDSAFFADKVLHPSDEGMEYYYKGLKSIIQNLLRRCDK